MSIEQPQFNGSIPVNYDKYLVPAIFRPFAESMATRVRGLNAASVLELACGTGAVTRYLAATLTGKTRLVATDFSPDMLEVAQQRIGDSSSIEWKIADACVLPFEVSSFEVIVCQFGAMTFPDKPAAMAEAFRVSTPGGHLIFSTWGPRSMNPIFQIVEETLTAMFPNEETPFMPTPFSMSNPNQHRDLAKVAGFSSVSVVEETLLAGRYDPTSIASGFAFGTPLGAYLAGQGYNLDEIQATLSANLAAALGDPIVCSMQAIVCHAIKV